MSLKKQLFAETSALGLPTKLDAATPPALVAEDDLVRLPEPAQRYLRFMGGVGKPRDWSFRVAWTGRFRTGPNKPWMKCEAWQYNTRLSIARFFYIRIRRLGLFSVLGRDTYCRGKGRMLVKLFDWITLADGQGPEYDSGELVTYLNDAVLLAPSLLLNAEIAWKAIDHKSFGLMLTDQGQIVEAQVLVDERGAPQNFSTTDRYYYDNEDAKHRLIRTRWTTPVEGWTSVNGRPVPTRGQAIWHLPQGPLPYADFNLVPESLLFNVPADK
jgi:hypothetical protein